MHRMILHALLSGVVATSLLAAARCHAQAFGGGESERAIRTQGVYVPYDGMPLTERYSYETGSYFFLNQDPRTLLLGRLLRPPRAGRKSSAIAAPTNPASRTPAASASPASASAWASTVGAIGPNVAKVRPQDEKEVQVADMVGHEQRRPRARHVLPPPHP